MTDEELEREVEDDRRLRAGLARAQAPRRHGPAGATRHVRRDDRRRRERRPGAEEGGHRRRDGHHRHRRHEGGGGDDAHRRQLRLDRGGRRGGARASSSNIKKYLMYLLSSNVGEIGLMAGPSLSGLPLPADGGADPLREPRHRRPAGARARRRPARARPHAPGRRATRAPASSRGPW